MNRFPALIAGVLFLQGCAAARLAPPIGEQVADPAGFEAELVQATLPATPLQVNFAWTLEEQASRVRGNGVVRLEAPERIRLDLFGPRGDTYLVAALEGEEYRLPPQISDDVVLPSPALLWSALGVLRPPPNASLTLAAATEAGAELRYETPEMQQFVYRFQNQSEGGPLLHQVQRAGRQGVIETVTVDRGPDGSVVRTRYRDWASFRDLTLDVESIRATGTFPVSIWRPDVATP